MLYCSNRYVYHEVARDQHVKSLRENAEPCTTCKDDTLITLIICGLHDEHIRQKLLSSSEDLTLEKVTKTIQANEAAKRDNEKFRGELSVHKAFKGHKPQGGNAHNPARTDSKPCAKCGNRHLPSGQCKAKGRTCIVCNEVGHFMKVCPTRNKNNEP